MDPRHRRRPSGDRFLTPFSLSPQSSTAGDNADDFSEDDIFFTALDFSNPPSTSTSTSTSTTFSLLKPFKPDTFGILAALPESSSSAQSPSKLFNHKPAISPSPSSSSSRMIPKPSNSMSNSISVSERQILFHQSAPMKVPVLARRDYMRRPSKGSAFGYDDENGDVNGENEEEDDDGEMLPPHEMVAKRMSKSPVLSCSVLEGVGRTLKGRDLRQVRNAVFRQTGFID